MKPSKYKKLQQTISQLHYQIRTLKEAFDCLNTAEHKLLLESQTSVKMLQTELERDAEIVNVSFSIGSRSYYEKAYKIGKFYYTVATNTKLTSYFSPTEIDEITDENCNEMVSDSYYY